MRKFAVAVATMSMLLLCGNSDAITTTWTFAGTVDRGANTGTPFNASLTFDPNVASTISMYPDSFVDSGYHHGGAVFFPPYPAPFQVSGSASSITESFAVGGGTMLDSLLVSVLKNWYDENYYQVRGDSWNIDGSYSYINFYTFDYLGSSGSSLFPDISAGLSLVQTVDWSVDPVYALACNYLADGSRICESAFGTVFVTTSVPEPGTLALLGFGLAGLGLSRRRKAN